MQALKTKYQAQKTAAQTNLKILLTNPSGIGEHSDIVTECSRWVQEIAEAEDALLVLKKLEHG